MVVPKRWLHAVVLAMVVQAPLVVSASADTVAVDAAALHQLQDVIQQQQEQLQKQSEQLKSQSEVYV